VLGMGRHDLRTDSPRHSPRGQKPRKSVKKVTEVEAQKVVSEPLVLEPLAMKKKNILPPV